MKYILSIDGGGIRGIIPALVLQVIEVRTGKRIASMFDLIAGTSTGGILACALTCSQQRQAADIVALYENEGPQIFSRSLLGKVGIGFGLFGPKYTADNLRAALKRTLAYSRLENCSPDILVTAYDIERRQPHFFKSSKARLDSERDYQLVDVAHATAAAPTYFPPARVERDSDYFALIDGGVYATNPALCALAEAMTMWPGEQITLISLGTGELTRRLPYEKAKNWGVAQWARPILDVVFDGASDTVDYQCRQILGDNYHRLQCSLDKASDNMDDASPDNLMALKLQAEELVQKNSPLINYICEQLTKEE